MSSFPCCAHLPIVDAGEALGGHHPACASTQEVQAEVRRLRAEVRGLREGLALFNEAWRACTCYSPEMERRLYAWMERRPTGILSSFPPSAPEGGGR
jgi:hypothetical protein